MANTLGLFDKQLVKVAWFDPTLQPGGWFSTDIVTTEGEAPTGVEATAALNEAADTGAAQVSVATHVTGVLVETGDSLASTGATLVGSTAAITEAADVLTVQSTVAVGATAALSQGADTVSGAALIAARCTAALIEANDTLAAQSGVSVGASSPSCGLSGPCSPPLM